MKTDQIKAIQTKVGAVADGIWGPKSKAACIAYLRGLCPNNPWPPQSKRVAFYGPPGAHQTRIDVTGLGVKYDGQTVNSILCHERVAASLLRIIRAIHASPFSYVLAHYAGCYAEKALLHGHAAAIDLDPDTNGMDAEKFAWPTKATMPFEVVEIFAREGWTSAGAYWGYDAMHFQATTW